MEKQELITMLNKDMAEEHAAILRYLVHSYLEGEDTPLGASLLSRAREEMWHMHWLGMIIGRLGGEPNLTPAPYPYDPTNRATIFKSYVNYELKLVPHYHGEADKVDDPHIKRVLQREGWESEYHARKFQRILDKMTPEQAEGLPGEENELPEEFVERLQGHSLLLGVPAGIHRWLAAHGFLHDQDEAARPPRRGGRRERYHTAV
jgi:bacterioferritin